MITCKVDKNGRVYYSYNSPYLEEQVLEIEKLKQEIITANQLITELQLILLEKEVM